jgi:transposase
MTNLPRYYDPLFKQLVVEYYLQDQPNVSFQFVGKIFQINGGHVTLKQWFDRYDGTIVSLQQRYRSGRPRILSKRQVNQLVTKIVYSHNRLSRPINYKKITNSIRQKTNTNVSIRTVRRYGKNSGIKQRKTIKRTYGESEYKNAQSLPLSILLFVLIVFHLFCLQ